MNENTSKVDDLINVMLKINPTAAKWQNVFAFIMSCYACRVLAYDSDAAIRALDTLAPEEQFALIEWVLREDQARTAGRFM